MHSIRQPRLVPGSIYSSRDIIENLEISNKTLAFWVRDGLRPLGGKTKTQLFLSDDIIVYMKSKSR